MSAMKERPTVRHSAQWHSLAHYDRIRKMVGLRNPASMYMATQQDRKGYSPPFLIVVGLSTLDYGVQLDAPCHAHKLLQ